MAKTGPVLRRKGEFDFQTSGLFRKHAKLTFPFFTFQIGQILTPKIHRTRPWPPWLAMTMIKSWPTYHWRSAGKVSLIFKLQDFFVNMLN